MKPVLVVNRVDRSVTRGTLSRPPPESIDSVDRQVRLIGGRTCQSVTSGFGRQSRYSGQESKKVGARGPIHRVLSSKGASRLSSGFRQTEEQRRSDPAL